MPTPRNGFRALYGASPLHLLALLAALALGGYAVTALGLRMLWNPTAWWQSIGVWFIGAIVLHDLLLFPLYALADRSLSVGLHALGSRRGPTAPRLSALNYIRLPALASGLLLLLFFPGIIEQGQQTYLAATGQTQQPFLARWLLITAAAFAASAVSYAVRLGSMRHRDTPLKDAPAGTNPQPAR